MEIFRISREEFSGSLSASGSANRWNLKGQQVIYAGSSRSLSSLELIVHKGSVKPELIYKMMVIAVADDDFLVKQIFTKDLPENWRTMAGYAALQKIGAGWYNAQESLLLKVHSAIIPMEYNFIINTEHPDFAKNVKLARLENYFWDSRVI